MSLNNVRTSVCGSYPKMILSHFNWYTNQTVELLAWTGQASIDYKFVCKSNLSSMTLMKKNKCLSLKSIIYFLQLHVRNNLAQHGQKVQGKVLLKKKKKKHRKQMIEEL